MNREILIDALEELDSGLIERYFEIKEKLIKRRAVTKSAMRWTVSAACIALIACTVIPLAMRISQPPDPPVVETPPGSEETTPPEDVTTEAPIKVEPPVYDPSEAYYEDYYRELSGSRYYFENWNGLMVANNLQYMLESYYQNKSRMYAINVFRHNDEILNLSDNRSFKDYSYQGKTYQDLNEEINLLIKKVDDLSEEMPEERDDLYSQINALYSKKKELIESYYCRYEPFDVTYFQGLGYITGEVNGKLYIIITYDQFLVLSNNSDMWQYGFAALPREDFLDIYPNAIYPK